MKCSAFVDNIIIYNGMQHFFNGLNLWGLGPPSKSPILLMEEILHQLIL